MTSHTDAAHHHLAAPPHPRRWLALAVLSLAQFMLILDVTVVNIALPDIGADLQLSRSALPWVITAYTLAFGGLMLLGGRIADHLGARRVVVAGLALFSAASLVSGLAPTTAVLLAGRAAQGVGAALLSPAALSIVTTTFHGPEHRRALGVWAALGGTGSAVGVLLGGVLTAGPGWQWIFFVNVPMGLAVLVAVPAVVPHRPRAAGRGRLDIAGAALVTAATAATLYGLITAGDRGWIAPGTLVPIMLGVVLYAGFVVVERRLRQPLMDVSLLARRPVAAGALLMLTASALLIGAFFLGSFSLQRVRGESALSTGLLFVPIAVGTILGAHLGSRLAGHVDGRALAAVALLLAAAGTGVVAVWPGSMGLVAGLGVAATGLGATFVAATTTALARIEPERAGLASGAINTFHELGGAIGVGVVSSIAAADLTARTAGAGFAHAFTFSAVAALAVAALAIAVVPAGTPPTSQTPHVH